MKQSSLKQDLQRQLYEYEKRREREIRQGIKETELLEKADKQLRTQVYKGILDRQTKTRKFSNLPPSGMKFNTQKYNSALPVYNLDEDMLLSELSKKRYSKQNYG